MNKQGLELTSSKKGGLLKWLFEASVLDRDNKVDGLKPERLMSFMDGPFAGLSIKFTETRYHSEQYDR